MGVETSGILCALLHGKALVKRNLLFKKKEFAPLWKQILSVRDLFQQGKQNNFDKVVSHEFASIHPKCSTTRKRKLRLYPNSDK